MIVQGINGIGADLFYQLHKETADVLGEDRMELIDNVIYNSIKSNICASYNVAISGALRWNPKFRPEVLVDAMGLLL